MSKKNTGFSLSSAIFSLLRGVNGRTPWMSWGKERLIQTSVSGALAGWHVRRAPVAFHLLACRSNPSPSTSTTARIASIYTVHRDFLIAFASWVFGTEI
jgi:hypothetical protein